MCRQRFLLKTLLTLCLLSLSPLSGAEDQKLPKEMQKVMDQKKYAHAIWGILVKDIKTGEVLYNLNGEKLFSPASTTKLVSVAAWLNAFGENYRFKTPVYAAGEVDNGRLTGDLIIVGQGDLVLGGRQAGPDTISYTKMDHITANDVPGTVLTKEDPLVGLKEMAKQIFDRGIKEIRGDIVVDDRLFETVEKRGVILSPLMVNENLIDIVINPGEKGQNAIVTSRPRVSGYLVENRVKTVAEGNETDIQITQGKNERHFIVEGSIPLGQKDIVRTAPIKNPSAFARDAFIDVLKEQGVTLHLPKQSTAKLPETYEGLNKVALFTSPPLSEYAKLILKVSHNIGADLIAPLLASKEGKKTFDEGMRLIGDFAIKEVKLSSDSFVLIDAAGGNENRLTPEAEVELLEYMHKKPADQFQRFFDALPILGVDGSLEDFGGHTDAKGKVRAKPGTGVAYNIATGNLFLITQAYAGYIEGQNGHLLAYVVVVNNASMPSIEDIFPIFEDEAKLSAIIYDTSNLNSP